MSGLTKCILAFNFKYVFGAFQARVKGLLSQVSPPTVPGSSLHSENRATMQRIGKNKCAQMRISLYCQDRHFGKLDNSHFDKKMGEMLRRKYNP